MRTNLYIVNDSIYDPAHMIRVLTYINKYSEFQHVKRDVDFIKENDVLWPEHCLGLGLGDDGCFYVGSPRDPEILNKSICSPRMVSDAMPSMWCPWYVDLVTGEVSYLDRTGKDTEKSAMEWLMFIHEHFLAPNKLSLSGSVEFSDGYAYSVCGDTVKEVPLFDDSIRGNFLFKGQNYVLTIVSPACVVREDYGSLRSARERLEQLYGDFSSLSKTCEYNSSELSAFVNLGENVVIRLWIEA